MLEILKFDLQLFGEGGDGGSTGDAGASTESGEIEIPSSIPERAHKHYKTAVKKMGASQPKVAEQTANVPNTTEEPTKVPYADLIKSDDYKDEHKAYMDKTIGDRLKKYKGIEETVNTQKSLLEAVGSKYGLDSASEDFLETLAQKIEEDDSYYENYAMEHDISTEEARKIVSAERKLAKYEAEQEAQRQREAQQEQIRILYQNAERTKQRFPDFNLETEMQDEKFRKLCAVNNGDTTAAYMACHWDSILTNTAQASAQKAKEQTAQAVAANKARPVENGNSSSATSVVETSFKGMSLAEIRAYAEEQRRKINHR